MSRVCDAIATSTACVVAYTHLQSSHRLITTSIIHTYALITMDSIVVLKIGGSFLIKDGQPDVSALRSMSRIVNEISSKHEPYVSQIAAGEKALRSDRIVDDSTGTHRACLFVSVAQQSLNAIATQGADHNLEDDQGFSARDYALDWFQAELDDAAEGDRAFFASRSVAHSLYTRRHFT